LLRIQNKYVPRKAKGGKKKLWMSYKALKYVKRKHKVFKKYKDTKHLACRSVANKASKELKKAKFNFEKKLADNIKNDSKSFYAYVRGGSKATKGALHMFEQMVNRAVKCRDPLHILLTGRQL